MRQEIDDELVAKGLSSQTTLSPKPQLTQPTFTAPTMPANTVETALTKLLGIKCVLT